MWLAIGKSQVFKYREFNLFLKKALLVFKSNYNIKFFNSSLWKGYSIGNFIVIILFDEENCHDTGTLCRHPFSS